MKNGEHQLRIESEAGACRHINIHYLSHVKDWEPFAQHAVNYCTGKKPISIKSLGNISLFVREEVQDWIETQINTCRIA